MFIINYFIFFFLHSQNVFAFHFRGDYPDDGWEVFDMEAELKRLVSTITSLDTIISTVAHVTHTKLHCV